MKTALCTTTINIPHVLALYRKLDPDVRFFVAGDVKTPEAAIEFCEQLGNVYLPMSSEWKCSELIGWNCIQRRNIATLEALKWGADVIITIDDDNIPLSPHYFNYFIEALVDGDYSDGFKVVGKQGWFDVGQLLDPVAPHRGFPCNIDPSYCVSSILDAKIGVAAGICLGDPDIDATTRIANAPTVHRVSELLRPGPIVDNQTWTVFNSQNTAFLRQFAPCMFLFPGVGRYDDIYASLFTQRIMRHLGYHVHFGQPFVWQQRNQHNLVTDLRQEIDGMENVRKLAEFLDDCRFDLDVIDLPKPISVLDLYRYLLNAFIGTTLLPKRAVEAALAWCDDIEEVMK